MTSFKPQCEKHFKHLNISHQCEKHFKSEFIKTLILCFNQLLYIKSISYRMVCLQAHSPFTIETVNTEQGIL